MSGISQLSTEQLKRDLNEIYNDAGWCRLALYNDEYEINGKSIQDRLEGNEHYIGIIEKELKKRGELDG